MSQAIEGRVTIQGVEVVVHRHHASLLVALEAAGFQPDYQCREGICGACKNQLVSGEVEYDPPPLAHLHKGEILTCCCKPKGSIELVELPALQSHKNIA